MSIFTCELYAIFRALEYLTSSSLDFYGIVISVDSKSVLYALQNWSSSKRKDLLFDIRYMIHCLLFRGIKVSFCWVPSHLGFYWNEVCDKLAKQGSKNYNNNSMNLYLTKHEYLSLVDKCFSAEICQGDLLSFSRHINSLIYKLRLNSWNTKFSKDVTCVCGDNISVNHILFECRTLSTAFRQKGLNLQRTDGQKILTSSSASEIAAVILQHMNNKL